MEVILKNLNKMTKKLEQIFHEGKGIYVDGNGKKINLKPLGLHCQEKELDRNSITEERVKELIKEVGDFFPAERSREINSYLVRECNYKGFRDHNCSLIDFYNVPE